MKKSKQETAQAEEPSNSVACQNTDGMIGIGGRWWRFPGARIDTDSWELEWRSDGKVYLHDEAGKIVEGTEVSDVMPPRLSSMKDHTCCYFNCPEPGAIHIGPNGGDSDWICFRHLDHWNQTRARLLANGGGCEMQELRELLTEAPSAAQPTGRARPMCSEDKNGQSK